MLEVQGRTFARDLPPWTTGPCSSGHGVLGVWAATLNHEIFDDAVEVKSVVEPVFDEFDEIGHSIWGTVSGALP